jgi:hypothetical protein
MSSELPSSDTSLDFGDDARAHNVLQRERRSPRFRILRYAGIALFLLGILLVPLLVILDSFGVPVIPESEGLGKLLEFKHGGMQGEVYYRDGASEEDARKLGRFLQEVGYFKPNKAATVQIRKPEDVYIVSCVVMEGAWNQDETVAGAHELRSMLSQQVFGNGPVIIHLCQKEVPVTAGHHLSVTVRKVIRE